MSKIFVTSSGSGGGGAVTSVNSLTGGIILTAGSNVTITDDGVNTITIASSGGGGGGITSINTDSTASQTLTVGTSGTDFAIVDNGTGGHAFNLPSASATARGVVTTGSQTIAGVKTFSSAPILSALTASQIVATDSGKSLVSIIYTNANTASSIVQRDASGNFIAGTITAALTGTASGNTTYTANNHGIVISSSTNAMTVIAPDASTTKVLKSGGASADPSWLAYDNANTVSTLVFRDGSGNFTAGTVTASVTGHASLDLPLTGGTMTGPIASIAGAANTPDYTGPTTNTGLFFPTSATMAFTSAGTEVWRTGANGITIGTTTVQACALYVVQNSSNFTGLLLKGTGTEWAFNTPGTSLGIGLNGANSNITMMSADKSITIQPGNGGAGTGIGYGFEVAYNSTSAAPTTLSAILAKAALEPGIYSRSRNTTTGILNGFWSVGSSDNVGGGIYTVLTTQTAASEVSYVAIATQKAGTLTEAARFDTNGNFITPGAHNTGVPQTTLTGSAGTAICSQPFQGTSYKKVIVYLNGYTDTSTQTYTFPTAFTQTPYVYGLAGGVSGATTTATTIKFTTTLLSGFVICEGY